MADEYGTPNPIMLAALTFGLPGASILSHKIEDLQLVSEAAQSNVDAAKVELLHAKKKNNATKKHIAVVVFITKYGPAF